LSINDQDPDQANKDEMTEEKPLRGLGVDQAKRDEQKPWKVPHENRRQAASEVFEQERENWEKREIFQVSGARVSSAATAETPSFGRTERDAGTAKTAGEPARRPLPTQSSQERSQRGESKMRLLPRSERSPSWVGFLVADSPTFWRQVALDKPVWVHFLT
jgi:hypothetical protein